MPRYPSRSPAAAIVLAAICLLALASCGADQGSSPGRAQPPAPPGSDSPILNTQICDGLTPLVRARIAAATDGQSALRVRSSGTAALSTCTFSSPVATISVSLDTATDSHQRFSNRLVEMIQFSGQDPAQLPKEVPRVGDPGADYGGADWITARAQLLAIRGDRLLIVGFYVRGAPGRVLRDGAAALARRAYASSSGRSR